MRYLKSKLFLFFALVISFPVVSQSGGQYSPPVPVDEESGKIIYRDVVQEMGTPDSLYLRGINWINQNFANPSDVTRVRDRENSTIKGTARMTLNRIDDAGVKVGAGMVEFTFTIECRPDRYRYTFFDFIYKQASRVPVEKWLDTSHPSWNPMMDDYLRQIDEHINKLIDSMVAGMKPKPKVVDEW